MSASVGLGLLMAICCAVVALLGFLLKQRGAESAPPVQWRHPLRSTVALFSNRVWTAGILVAIGAWGFHVAALALAPISLVQCVIAGGLVLLTPMANLLFDHRVGRRDWIGVGVAAAGLALLAVTLEGGADQAYDSFADGTLAIYVTALTMSAIVLCALVTGDGPRAGVVLAVAAGLLWGASDVSIKAASASFGSDGLAVLATPLTAVVTILSLVGLVVSARSLQLGPAVTVIALTSVAANVVTIAAGPVVFGEPLPDGDGALAGRLLAFVLVIAGSALTPGASTDAQPMPDAEPQPA